MTAQAEIDFFLRELGKLPAPDPAKAAEIDAILRGLDEIARDEADAILRELDRSAPLASHHAA